jgi:hypothetical protein
MYQTYGTSRVCERGFKDDFAGSPLAVDVSYLHFLMLCSTASVVCSLLGSHDVGIGPSDSREWHLVCDCEVIEHVTSLMHTVKDRLAKRGHIAANVASSAFMAERLQVSS